MSVESSRAVFISYASQDAEAARRICEALRAAGVEVWFDQNELRGGDAWDQKIRRQIKECALFIPLISANTNARLEGYYRLEWKLAIDRSHLMAEEKAFLVPAVIDDTAEATAKVPDRFRDFQWTRLDLRETPASLAERIAKLLGGETEPGRPGERGEGAASPRGNRGGRWQWWMVFPVVGTLVSLGFMVLPLWHAFNRPAAPAAKPVATNVEQPVVPVSDARALVIKARALFEPLDGATRQDFLLAEDLLKRAVAFDPTDGEVWAAQAQMLSAQVSLGHDTSPARIEAALASAERAMRLAPESRQARFAQAGAFRLRRATQAEAERALRELVEQGPDDRLILRTYASMLRGRREFDAALAFFDRAAALPGGDVAALYGKYGVLAVAQRHEEAEAVLDAAIAAQPAPYLLRAKVSTLMFQHGDLDGAAKVLARVPGAYLLEDIGAYAAHQLWLWRREPEKAVRVWLNFSRELVECAEFAGPRRFSSGRPTTSLAGQRRPRRNGKRRSAWSSANSLRNRARCTGCIGARGCSRASGAGTRPRRGCARSRSWPARRVSLTMRYRSTCCSAAKTKCWPRWKKDTPRSSRIQIRRS
jgi:Tfp pilus assembly protein PilF